MTDTHAKLLRMNELVGPVEFIESGRRFRLVWEAADKHHAAGWRVDQFWEAEGRWLHSHGNVTAHEACCLLLNAAEDRLRELWEHVDVRFWPNECVVSGSGTIGNRSGHVAFRYTGPTKIHAWLSACEGEL